jgi:hypothetical protein
VIGNGHACGTCWGARSYWPEFLFIVGNYVVA